MMIQHPTEAELVALIHLDLSPVECRSVLVHLVACKTCRYRLLSKWGAEARQCLTNFFGPTPVRVWAREAKKRAETPDPALVAAYRLLEELAEVSPAHGELLAVNRGAYQTLPGAVTILEEVRRLWLENPAAADRLTDAAETILHNLLRETPTQAAAHLARCWAIRANVRRLRGKLREAAAALTEAQAWLRCCPSGPRLEREVQLYEGLVYREFYGPGRAIATLESALSPPGPSGGYTIRIEATITLAHAYWAVGEGDKAIETVSRILNRYSRAELGELLYLAALQNITIWLARSGRPAEARDMLPALQKCVARPDMALLRLRVVWAEAEICKAENNRPAAASLYREAQQGFQDFDLPYDTALVTLDLALLHLKAGDTRAAKELAEELIPIFEARDIHREATAAGLLLVESLRQEAATVQQVKEVSEILSRGQWPHPERLAASERD